MGLIRANPVTKALAAVGAGALILRTSAILLDLFGLVIPYSMKPDREHPLDSDEFIQFLSVVTDGAVRRSRITRLENGAEFYPAELEAIRRARHAVNFECYSFAEGRVSGEILSGAEQFEFRDPSDGAKGFVVISTPHGGTQPASCFRR